MDVSCCRVGVGCVVPKCDKRASMVVPEFVVRRIYANTVSVKETSGISKKQQQSGGGNK